MDAREVVVTKMKYIGKARTAGCRRLRAKERGFVFVWFWDRKERVYIVLFEGEATVKAAKKDEYIDRIGQMGRENRIKVHVPKGAGAWNRVAKGRKERQGQNAWRTRVSKWKGEGRVLVYQRVRESEGREGGAWPCG